MSNAMKEMKQIVDEFCSALAAFPIIIDALVEQRDKAVAENEKLRKIRDAAVEYAKAPYGGASMVAYERLFEAIRGEL